MCKQTLVILCTLILDLLFLCVSMSLGEIGQNESNKLHFYFLWIIIVIDMFQVTYVPWIRRLFWQMIGLSMYGGWIVSDIYKPNHYL